MKTLDIESKNYTVEEAMREFNTFLKRMINDHEIIIKVIHGYGSNNHGGGFIRNKVIKRLNNLSKNKEIIGYITGDFHSNMERGFGDLKIKYNQYLKGDSAYMHDNEGITYICLREPK